MEGTLSGVRVLDLSVALAGPFATFNLAGLGADVIKIEAPGGSDIGRGNPPYLGSRGLHSEGMVGDDISVSMLDRSRGKRSVTIDLKQDEGRELFLRLVEHADLVVENMSAGTADRLRVGYADVRKVNPAILYCSISAFGEGSPFDDMKGMDIHIQALSGLMSATGFADGPPVRVGIPIGDIVGSLYATIGILAAIRHRDRTGEGQHIRVSLWEALTTLVATEHFDAEPGEPRAVVRSGNSHERLTPFGAYQTLDGYMALGATTDALVVQLFRAMERLDLIDDPRFASRGARLANSAALNDIVL